MIHLVSLLLKALVVAIPAQLVQSIQVLILFIFIHSHEKSRLLAFIDPVDFEDFKSRRSHELVQFGEDLPGCGFLEILGDWTSLNNHSKQVQVVSLLQHQLVSCCELFTPDQLVRLHVDLGRSWLGCKLLLKLMDLGLESWHRFRAIWALFNVHMLLLSLVLLRWILPKVYRITSCASWIKSVLLKHFLIFLISVV